MEECMQKIKVYIKQLSELGYRSFQIDRIIKEAIGTNNLYKLNREQVFSLMEALAEQIQYVKCRHFN